MRYSLSLFIKSGGGPPVRVADQHVIATSDGAPAPALCDDPHRAAVPIDLDHGLPPIPRQFPKPRPVDEPKRMALSVQPLKERFVLKAREVMDRHDGRLMPSVGRFQEEVGQAS